MDVCRASYQKYLAEYEKFKLEVVFINIKEQAPPREEDLPFGIELEILNDPAVFTKSMALGPGFTKFDVDEVANRVVVIGKSKAVFGSLNNKTTIDIAQELPGGFMEVHYYQGGKAFMLQSSDTFELNTYDMNALKKDNIGNPLHSPTSSLL